MADSLLGDFQTASGDAVFVGEVPELIIVHNQPLDVGDLWCGFRIVRESSKEEFLSRCPQVQTLTGIDQYFFYWAELASGNAI